MRGVVLDVVFWVETNPFIGSEVFWQPPAKKAMHHVSDHRFALRLALCLYDFGNVCALSASSVRRK